MNYSGMTQRETEIELSTSVSEGLTSFAAHDRLIDGGRNLPEKAYAKSAGSLVITQFTDLYTIAFIVMGIITALCDFKASFAAWMIFFAVAVIKVVSGFLRDNKERKNAVDFDRRRAVEVKVIRDSKQVTIEPTLLVKGDIVVLEEGDFVPADLRILQCDALKADESIFKGNNVPLDKQSERIDEEEALMGASNMLYAGSRIAQGYALGAVVATGKDTLIASSKGRKKGHVRVHNNFAKNAVSEKMLTLGAILCAIFTLVFVSVTKKDVTQALMSACAISLCLLPAPVALVREIALRSFGKKAEKKGVLIKEREIIEKIGKTEYLLFDKGGIITNGEMTLEESVVADGEKLKIAAICTDCEFVEGKLSGSEIDRATCEEISARGIDVEKLFKEHETVMYMPFDETRKLMAVIVKWDEGYRVIVKGSVDVIPNMCTHIADEDDTKEMSGEMLVKIERVTSSMAEKGLKIRAVAYRDIDAFPESIEDELKNLVFGGVFGYREVLERKLKESVKKIESMCVRPIMVTGDHSITAASLARLAGIIRRESECVSFRELQDCTDKELCEAANKYKVFASASKEDRIRLARALSKYGHTVAVAGEQMTDADVALYADVVFGENEENGANVLVEKTDMKIVSEAVYHLRAMRGNMAYASLLAIAIGVAEVLTLIFMLLTKPEFEFTSLGMLVLNLFVAFAPCMTLAFLARVSQKLNDGKMLALKCVLQGFICAIFALLAQGNVMLYFAFYSLIEAGRVCASFHNLEKARPGGKGVVITMIMTVIAIVCANVGFLGVFTNDSMGAAFFSALVAVIINGVISRINLKGKGKANV